MEPSNLIKIISAETLCATEDPYMKQSFSVKGFINRKQKKHLVSKKGNQKINPKEGTKCLFVIVNTYNQPQPKLHLT